MCIRDRPCRVRDPDRKGKVESAVGHAQQKLRGLRFESIEEAQAYLDRWEVELARKMNELAAPA